MSSDDSADGASDTALVIAEDSDESTHYTPKGQRGSAKKRITKKDPTYAPRQGGNRKKPPAKSTDTAAKKKTPVSLKYQMCYFYVYYYLFLKERMRKFE